MLRKNVSFINCSFSKILLIVASGLAGFWLCRTIFTPEKTYAAPVTLNTLPNRALKWHGEEKNENKVPDNYIEVQRNAPKVSYSTKQTLEKLLEKERLERNKSPGYPVKLAQDEVFVGASMGYRGNAGLSKLKDNLRDPSFVGKIQDLEAKRQGLYISILRRRGQIVETEQGDVIVSYPQAPVMFPNNLKKPLDNWSKSEKIWLNITHFPWPEDETCQKYSVTFGKNIPIVGLASYPSSGNTWIRYLVECASGIFSGSMYNDVMLRKKGFYGEGLPEDSQIVLTVKTHGHTTGDGSHVDRDQQQWYNHMKEVNETAILLIRNPFEAIIGHRNLDQGGHTGLAKPEEFTGAGWNTFVKIKADAWLNFYKDWLEGTSSDKILVIHYEHLKLNVRHTIRRILDFLNLEEDEGRLGCIDLYPSGHFKRDHHRQTIENPFTVSQKEMISNSIHELDQYLARWGKERLPTKLYKYYN